MVDQSAFRTIRNIWTVITSHDGSNAYYVLYLPNLLLSGRKRESQYTLSPKMTEVSHKFTASKRKKPIRDDRESYRSTFGQVKGTAVEHKTALQPSNLPYLCLKLKHRIRTTLGLSSSN